LFSSRNGIYWGASRSCRRTVRSRRYPIIAALPWLRTQPAPTPP